MMNRNAPQAYFKAPTAYIHPTYAPLLVPATIIKSANPGRSSTHPMIRLSPDNVIGHGSS